MLYGDDTAPAAASGAAVADPAVEFLVANPNPDVAALARFLGPLSHADRDAAIGTLVAQGVSPTTIQTALASMSWLHRINWNTVKGVATLAGAAAVGFHGARRNNSVGWGVAWFAFGALAPVAASAIAVGQGFGKRKGT